MPVVNKKRLKFNKPKTNLPLAPGAGQGLAGNRVQLRGNKAKKKKHRDSSSVSSDASSLDSIAEFPEFPGGGGALQSMARGDGGGLKKFDKLINSRRKKKAQSRGGGGDGGASFVPPRGRRGGATRGFSPPPAVSKAPEDFSSDESDSSDFPSDSDLSDDLSDDFSDDGMSLSGMSSTGQDVPLDDAMSLLSGDGGRGKKPMFGGITSKEAEEAEKSDLLARFHLLKQRKVHISKNYTPKSSLNEMRMEMGRIEHEAQVAQSIKVNRRMLMAGVSMFEEGTNRVGPRFTRGKFNRVSHFVQNSIKDYDSAFERMSEEYGGVIGALTGGNPIYEILFTLGYQMLTYATVYRGAETAAANEELTAQDVKRRFPQLVEAAAEEMLRQQQRLQPPPPQQHSQYQHYHHQPQAQYPQPPQHGYHQQPQSGAPQPSRMSAGADYPIMAAPSIDIGNYMQEQPRHQEQTYQDQQPSYQDQQPSYQGQAVQPPNINTENPNVFAFSPDQARVPPPPQAGARPFVPQPAQQDTLISEMHQPLPHVPYQQGEHFTEEDELPQFGGPSESMSTRRGRPPQILHPSQMAVSPLDVPLPSDDDDDFSDSGEDEDNELVIDIK